MRNSERKQKELDSFFGYGNTRKEREGFVSYRSILSSDRIVVKTGDVKSIRFRNEEGMDVVGWILMVGNFEYVSLQAWQVKRALWLKEDGTKEKSYLVKLDRKYFHIKRMAEPFEKEFLVTDSFDGLYEHARLQGLSRMAVKLL